MATAGQIVESALKRILVQATDAPLAADETADALLAMNNFMSSLEAKNVRLGYTPVTTVGDEVTIPDGAVRGLIANLAIDIAPDYGAEISPGLVLQAKDGMTAMRRLGRQNIQTSFPANLPIGSGNWDDTFSEPYYERGAEFLLALSESVTTFTGVGATSVVNGFWTVEKAKRLTADINGLVTNNTSDDVFFSINVRLFASGDGTYTLSLFRSGEVIATVQKVLSSDPSEMLIKTATTAQPGDTLQLKLRADTAANDVTVHNAQFEGT